MKKQIRLSNGKTVNINANLTAMTLFKLEKEEVIDKSFLSSLFSTGGIQNIDLLDTFRTVYAAYRQANPIEFMPFEAFMELYEVDMSESVEIFGAIMKKERKNNMAKGFNHKSRGKKA
ncbi:hypothetical protein COD67_22735 [Bacillus cereus]|nr:hypothetical protein COI89_01995 [Bacillus cereus]PGU62639.1 hypothetical protein COD67_22735 [Bacillus cereus]